MLRPQKMDDLWKKHEGREATTGKQDAFNAESRSQDAKDSEFQLQESC